MTNREAMQMALDALNYAADEIWCENDDDIIADARTAIRAALAQPDRKPLSDDEIKKLHHLIDWTNTHTYKDFAHAIEAAHGIKND